jgi:adenylate cyclase
VNSKYILFAALLLLFIVPYSSFTEDSELSIVNPENAETVRSLDTRTYLAKNWKFIVGDNLDYAKPDFNDSSWESKEFPILSFPYDIGKSKFFWFRKLFYVSGSLSGKPLSYVAGKLPDSTALYFNGTLISMSGSMPPDEYFGTPSMPRTYLIPDLLVNFGGKNVIAMRVYTERAYGDLKVPFITNNTDRLNTYQFDYAVNNLIPMIIVVLSLLVAVYFLLMFFRNTGERFNLYMSIALLMIGTYASGLAIESLPISNLLASQVWYGALLVAQLFFVFYFQDFYRIHMHWLVKLILGIITTGCVAVLFLAKTMAEAFFLVYQVFYLVLVTPLNVYVFLLSILAILRGNRYARVLIIGVSIVLITATHDIIYAMIHVEPPVWLANSGVLFYILSMFLTAANHFVDTKKEVEKLNVELRKQKDAFFRFVPTQFLSLLGKQSAVDISLGDSSLKSMSVLFSDIRKFTSIAEEMDPEHSFNLLNSYLLRMELPINSNDGFVDKYVGDAIMALFSETPGLGDDPNEKKTSADRAINAAVGMRRQLDEFNRLQRQGKGEILNIGIGINTGSLMLGTVGSEHRLDTTVIGDSVNLASRLEKLTQYYRSSIIISEWTFNHLTSPRSLLIREIDRVIVKGKTEPCLIYDVYEADGDEEKEYKLKTVDIINAGMDRYKTRKFKEAIAYFREAKSMAPGDIIPVIYLKRCIEYLRNPPPTDWPGVFKVHA